MKLAVFEARPDESEYLEALRKRHSINLTITDEVPSPTNARMAEDCEGVSILGQGRIDRALLEQFHALGVRYLSTRTVGYDHIDLSAAKELGIRVCNAGYAPNGVADFTIMMILMCLRNFKQAFWRGYVNDFSLGGLMGRDMAALTVGVMGTGRIGFQVIRNLSGFGCRIIAYDVFRNEAVREYAEYVELDELYAQSDIITLHMPLLPSTEHIIDSDAIAKMKKGVILVNCARGELTDVGALIEGIESERIGALGMDTVEGEQSIVHRDRRVDIIANRDWFYLHQFRNVIMTQHMAFYTAQAVESMVYCGIEGILSMKETGSCPTMLV